MKCRRGAAGEAENAGETDNHQRLGGEGTMDGKFIQARQCGDEFNAYRFQSGRQVLDEALIEGYYLTRYRNAFGQIVPEMHLTSARVLDNALEADAASCFRLQVNGRYEDGNWKMEHFGQIEDWTDLGGEAKAYGVTLFDDSAQVAVTVLTRLNGSDFIVRALKIENRSGAPIALTRVSPLYGLIWSHSHRTEAAPLDAEFSMAYNHLKPQLMESDFYFDTVPRSRPDIMDSCLSEGITVSGDTGKSGWQRPGVWLRNNMNGETLVCEFAWSGNWQIHAHAVPYSKNAMLVAEVGLLPLECEALRVLMRGRRPPRPRGTSRSSGSRWTASCSSPTTMCAAWCSPRCRTACRSARSRPTTAATCATARPRKASRRTRRLPGTSARRCTS
jgi:hypothetical protein